MQFSYLISGLLVQLIMRNKTVLVGGFVVGEVFCSSFCSGKCLVVWSFSGYFVLFTYVKNVTCCLPCSSVSFVFAASVSMFCFLLVDILPCDNAPSIFLKSMQ